MELLPDPSNEQDRVKASKALHGVITKLLGAESDSLAHELRPQGMHRALVHEMDEDTGNGRHVVVASYGDEVVSQVADLVSGEARALGPFTGHMEFDIRTSTTAATGIVYTRQNDLPVVLFSRKLNPTDRLSSDSQETFEFTRQIGMGLLWAEHLYNAEPVVSVERDIDSLTLNGLMQFLGSYLPAEEGS